MCGRCGTTKKIKKKIENMLNIFTTNGALITTLFWLYLNFYALLLNRIQMETFLHYFQIILGGNEIQ